MEFVTVSDLEIDLIKNLQRIPRDIDLVVGIPRSGMLVASLISLQLNLPLADIDTYISGNYYTSGNTKNSKYWVTEFSQIKKVLVVEDSVCNGYSILSVKRRLAQYERINHCYFAAYVTPEKRDLVDIYLRIIEFPRLFEWNYMHNKLLKHACFDLDGVLCDNPSQDENDDGHKYLDFIKYAKLKFKPTYEIGCIVSSRLEKYRKETEEWLKKNDIQYGELFLSSHETAEDRKKANDYAFHKANIYINIKNTIWFVESDEQQAYEIAKISRKPVFCVDTLCYYQGSSLNSKLTHVRIQTKRDFKHIVSRILPRKLKANLKNNQFIKKLL
ncbi:phosphoribosyltransferase [Clostridia bacterium]|nr:phosphoribosyltransferase [Clostridia bacterium]